MSGINVNFDVVNQKGTPAFYSDIFANRPTYGYPGRVFISTDTGAIYEDTGSAWTLIADAGAGTTGTLQQVTTNGNTTTQGISISAGGLSSNSVSIVGGTASQFLKADGTLDSSTYLTTGSAASTYLPLAGGTLTGNLSIPSSQLAIGTATAGAPLDIHTSTGTAAQFNGTGVNNAYIFFQNAGTSKWRIGNYYNGATNQFTIYNNAAAVTQLVMDSGATTLIGNFTATTLIKSGGTSSQFLKADGSVDSNTYITTNTSQTIAASITKTWNNEMRFGLGTMYDNGTGVALANGFTTINAGLTGSNTFLSVWRSNSYKLTLYCDLSSTGSTFTLPAGQSNALIATATGTSSQLIAGDGTLISAGTNITITGGTISASGGGSGVTSLSAIGSTANANGATITGSVLNLQPASVSFGGVVTTGTQTFEGIKSFNAGAYINNGQPLRLYNTSSGDYGNITFETTTGFAFDKGATMATSTTSSANILTIKNTNTSVGNNAPTIALDCSATNPDQTVDIRLGSTTPKGIRIYSNNTALTGIPIGAGFQMYSNAASTLSGQMYFDSGALNAAFISFRTAPTSGTITQRMVIDSSGNVTVGPTAFSASKMQITGSVAIGYSTSTTAPSNGLVVSGTTLLGTTTDNGQGVLQVAGGITASGLSTSGEVLTGTATFSKAYYHVIDSATPTGQTFTLPTPTSNNYNYVIVNLSGFSQTIAAASTKTIVNLAGSGVASITLASNARCWIIADGGNKYYQIF